VDGLRAGQTPIEFASLDHNRGWGFQPQLRHNKTLRLEAQPPSFGSYT
jgi:hypothetical protein